MDASSILVVEYKLNRYFQRLTFHNQHISCIHIDDYISVVSIVYIIAMEHTDCTVHTITKEYMDCKVSTDAIEYMDCIVTVLWILWNVQYLQSYGSYGLYSIYSAMDLMECTVSRVLWTMWTLQKIQFGFICMVSHRVFSSAQYCGYCDQTARRGTFL